MSRICWSVYRMQMTGQIQSLVIFGPKTPQFRFILKTVLISVWIPNSKERIKSQEIVPGSAGEDLEVALLRMWNTGLGVGVRVCRVGNDFVLHEWIRVDYITYLI
jgi:hypothetical protein